MRIVLCLELAFTVSTLWAQTTKAVPGTSFCGHVIDAGTFVDAHAENASRDEAFVMRWLDAESSVHSVLYAGRCVAKDADTIDGKVIFRVLPNSLALSDRHGLTAWEAEYWGDAGERARGVTPHRGVFSDNRFIAELDRSKASEPGRTETSDVSRDFQWNQELETLALKPGVTLIPAPPHYAYQASSTSPCAAVPAKQSFLDKLKRHAEQTLERQAGRADAQISKGTKGGVDGGVQDTTTATINQANQPSPCGPAKGQGAK
jgi:hypothetical protein